MIVTGVKEFGEMFHIEMGEAGILLQRKHVLRATDKPLTSSEDMYCALASAYVKHESTIKSLEAEVDRLRKALRNEDKS